MCANGFVIVCRMKRQKYILWINFDVVWKKQELVLM